jgi:hypothetical protein
MGIGEDDLWRRVLVQSAIAMYGGEMPGAVGVNKTSGAQSEILAEYLFSHGGPVLRGRDESDYGVDLFCALAKRDGQQMLVSWPYTVQVKSNRAPWRFEASETIEWLVNHPSPFFLAIVDKSDGTIDVFQTFARFDLYVHARYPTPLVLRPGKPGEGSVGLWDGVTNNYDLGAPIVRVTASELLNEQVLAERLAVLSKWVDIERKNIVLRDLGLLRFRGPQGYKTNEIAFSGWNEKGLGHVSAEQLGRALHALGESLDCVGSQYGYVKRDTDPETLLLMMMLMRRITDGGRKGLSVHDGIAVGGLGPSIIQSGDAYVGESIDRAIQTLLADPSTVELVNRIRTKK